MGPPHAVVVGRYAGTVGVLADLLAAGGLTVAGTAAVDAGGLDAVAGLLGDQPGAVVVATLAPDDAVAGLLTGRRVVAVTWHPADERPEVPAADVLLVHAGRIRRDLAATVRRAARAG